ncbi:family 10 glycosylhydrolase [Anabaena sphaerica FACHB-251]|uniref:Family 10 glycosylhydrolase n=1 Tax=Anabaena sphaerica FACHB-251 TaxID=2692883 RepID=A0A926WFQ8_9NOST|nr:family 10 glycosylhydrolase [Anabaena sphaerica]MBD2292661.1 family 10 glycosylhydrolase [Anabaena sphaerica FACHB-251]
MSRVEIRGVWLTKTDSQVLKSRQNIAEAMEFLAETGFNVVFPVVWNQGVTLYPSPTMWRMFGIEIDSRFLGRDPLREVVEEARRVGLKVIPWFEYGFASSYNLNGGMLLQQKPEWGAYDYKGNLLKKNGFEWLNAFDFQVQEFLLNLVLEVVKNYDVDGVQGDDRFPALPSEGGYDQGTINRYRQEFQKNPPQNHKDKHWLQWRANILTDVLALLYQEVKAVNPDLLVSISPNIYDWGLREYLQDSPTWLKRGIVDIIHPQIYRRDFLSYKCIIDRLVNEQFTDAMLPKLAPGILIKLGKYRISPNYLLQVVEYHRKLGISGEICFFYEGLRENNCQLAKVLKNGPYAQSALFPNLADLDDFDVSSRRSTSILQQLEKRLRKIFKV